MTSENSKHNKDSFCVICGYKTYSFAKGRSVICACTEDNLFTKDHFFKFDSMSCALEFLRLNHPTPFSAMIKHRKGFYEVRFL